MNNMKVGDFMWINERKEIIDYKKIIEFISQNNYFHDLRIGGLDYDSDKKIAKIMLEEVDNSKKINQDDVKYQYYFEVDEVKNFIFHSDLALPSFVVECIESDNNQITIELTNGRIVFTANKITLSVPINYNL